MANLEERLRRCYELSWAFASSKPDWFLIHGFITDNHFGTGNTIDHAWCLQFSTGIVHDPVMNQTIRLDDYIKIYGAEETIRYTAAEACLKSLQHLHYGPWHEIDNSKIILNTKPENEK